MSEQLPLQWRSMTVEEFRALRVGDRLVDRQGTMWTVRAVPRLDPREQEHRAVLRSQAHVRNERERYHAVYMLLRGSK